MWTVEQLYIPTKRGKWCVQLYRRNYGNSWAYYFYPSADPHSGHTVQRHAVPFRIRKEAAGWLRKERA